MEIYFQLFLLGAKNVNLAQRWCGYRLGVTSLYKSSWELKLFAVWMLEIARFRNMLSRNRTTEGMKCGRYSVSAGLCHWDLQNLGYLPAPSSLWNLHLDSTRSEFVVSRLTPFKRFAHCANSLCTKRKRFVHFALLKKGF